jgi:hypothetical protein
MSDVLRLNVIMELPEGFKGGLREAFEIYLQKREEARPLLSERDVSRRVAWEAFQCNRRHGATVVAEDGIFSLKTGSWLRKDKLPASALMLKDTWVK